MTSDERQALANLKFHEQHGKCAGCGEPLVTAPDMELAHKIPRGKVVRELGKRFEWHPKVIALVCTRYGKRCNDAVLIGAAHPVEEKALLDEIRGVSHEQIAPTQPLGV